MNRDYIRRNLLALIMNAKSERVRLMYHRQYVAMVKRA